jgi:hypothetical protein
MGTNVSSSSFTPGPLFVVGMWRSGTSLLYTLLNQHPQIALLYEGDLPLLRALFRKGKSSAEWQERWEFWNQAPSRHKIDLSKVPTTAPDLQSAAIAAWQEYAGLALYGDKSPNYFDSLPQLAREFPNARFIVIWRDLADICRSMINARSGSSYFRKRGIMHRAVIGYHKLKQGCDSLLSMGIPLHQIQYEEMIQKPEVVLSGVCRFLDMRYDQRMTQLDSADRSAIYNAAHHSGVKSDKIGLDKQRPEVLSPALKRKIDAYVAYWKEEYGSTWPLFPATVNAEAKAPGLIRRSLDYALFSGLREFDKFTSYVYCYAPIGLLRGYRSLKARGRATVETKAERSSFAEPAPERARSTAAQS